jgi:EAL domain-containing protein (putative c-di-GMP-specific phosphodiesterase class I)/AmiR/NasT family two-component response regulator
MPTDYSGLSILVIDDQQYVRKFIRDQLSTFGIERVEEASSGRAALQIVTQPGVVFDLILCDLGMPDMDGIETIRAMANMGLRSAVAILSVEEERVIESAGLLAKLGGLRLVGELAKPLTREKLEPLLERVSSTAQPEEPSARVITAHELETALDAKALEIHYQPMLKIRSGDCVGVEAMPRWTHLVHGLMTSDDVMPVAEHSNELLTRVTQLTLAEAIGASGRWHAAGHEIGVSVNLSPKVLEQLDMPDYVEQVAKDNRVPPAHVTIEVSEHTLGGDLATMIDVAVRLRLKGFRLSLQDYTGTQSRVAEILQLPFNELKLSRDCVAGCSSSTEKRALAQAGLSLAQNLRLTTVASGVSSRPDWNLLLELGCDVAQGSFIAHPMPESGLGMWVTQWTMKGHQG